MPITLDGTLGITTPGITNTGNESYAGTLTGGTGVINIGSGQFYKDASGNIGIGTISPSYRVHSIGTVGSGTTGTNGKYAFKRSSDGVEQAAISVDGTSLIYNNGTGGHIWQQAGTERVRIDGSGNLLVGETSSTLGATGRGVIEINGSSSALLGLNVGGSTTSYLYADATNLTINNTKNGAMQFNTNNVERMRVDSSGNLLVGTTATIAPLTVSGTTSGGTAWFQHNGGNSFGTVLTLETIGGTDDPSLSFKNYNGGSPTYYGISGTDDGSLAFKSGASSGGFGTERMRISSVGYLTIPYQVSFNAYTTTSIGTGATVVPFTGTNHNIGGAFSTSTGRFTAPIAGRYLITAGIAFASATYYDIILRKNNATLGNSQFGQNGGGSGFPQSSITQVIQLAAGDYIEMYMTGANAGASRPDFTYFTGELLG